MKNATPLGSRPNKNTARTIALRGGPARSSLLLPGKEIADVRLGLRLGTFDQNSTSLFVERDPKNFRTMSEEITAVWPNRNAEFFSGELHQVLPPKLDLAFLDFHGNVKGNDAAWLATTLAPALRPTARFYMTVTNATRGSEFINALWRHIPKEHGEIFKQVAAAQTDYCIPPHVRTLFAVYRLFLDLVVFPQFEVQWGVHPYRDVPGPNMMLISTHDRCPRRTPLTYTPALKCQAHLRELTRHYSRNYTPPQKTPTTHAK